MTSNLILSIDLSTKPGLAIFKDDKLIHSCTIFNDMTVEDFGDYPYNYIKFSQYTINKLVNYINQLGHNFHDFDKIIIEETSKARQNYSQKKLEFLHYTLLLTLSNLKGKIVYIRSEVWKRLNDAKMSKEEKANNAKIQRLKKKTGKKQIRKDEDGNKVRKVTRQDAYVRRCNELFGLKLERRDEDQAAAILMARGYLMGAPVCDGTVLGGLIEK